MTEIEFVKEWTEFFNGAPTPLLNSTVIAFLQHKLEVEKSETTAIIDSLIPDGYTMVPVEPTDAMIAAWCSIRFERLKRRIKDDNDCNGPESACRADYKAMLSAFKGE